jgi:hypothetical protein
MGGAKYKSHPIPIKKSWTFIRLSCTVIYRAIAFHPGEMRIGKQLSQVNQQKERMK